MAISICTFCLEILWYSIFNINVTIYGKYQLFWETKLFSCCLDQVHDCDMSRLWEMPKLLWEPEYCWHLIKMCLTESLVPQIWNVGSSSFAIKKPCVNFVWPILNLFSIIFSFLSKSVEFHSKILFFYFS